jgi:hypothetical protein
MLLRDGAFTEEELAAAIVISTKTLERYRAGKLSVPLDRQLCLALVLIQLPAYARLGFQLRGQVEAAMRFEQRAGEIPAVASLLAWTR